LFEKLTEEVQQPLSVGGFAMLSVSRKRLLFQANKLSLAIQSSLSATLYATNQLIVAMTAYATSGSGKAKLPLFMRQRLFTYGNIALAILWTTLVRHDLPRRGPEPSEPMRQVVPVRMSIEEHWHRATRTIAAAIASFQRVQMFQAAAAGQIDAADYALQHLLTDLCIAMPIPADGSALRAFLATAEGAAAPADEALAA
jgi:hypothetical protein